MASAARAAAVTGVGRAGPGPGRMRAWRVHAYGPGELRLDTARVPPLRAPDHLLVRVQHSSINPIDVAMIGGYGCRILNVLRRLDVSGGGGGAGGVEFPLVVGRDFAGVVERRGAGARARRGDVVWGVLPPHWPGAHAEYVLVRDCWTGPAPERLGAAAGGALYAGLTACSLLRTAGLWGGGGGRVLLLGLGGVGHAALQLLVTRGARVVVGCSKELHERALQAGAAVVLDRHDPGYSDSLVSCGPYEAILDCAGLGGGEAGARGWQFGCYVTLSSPLLRETDARGLCGGGLRAALSLAEQCAAAARAAPSPPTPAGRIPPHVRWAYFMPIAEDIDLLYRLAEKGQFNVEVERTYGWWEMPEALSRAAPAPPAPGARGKLLLQFNVPQPDTDAPAETEHT